MSEQKGIYETAPQPDAQQYAALGVIMGMVRAMQTTGVDVRACDIYDSGKRLAAIVLPAGYVWHKADDGTFVLIYDIGSEG